MQLLQQISKVQALGSPGNQQLRHDTVTGLQGAHNTQCRGHTIAEYVRLSTQATRWIDDHA